MNEDLKIIKKKYGEKMMHLCRNMFSTILEEKGLLPKLLLEHFEPSHDLYNDLEKYSSILFAGFEGYINSLVVANKKEMLTTSLTPEELLDKAGYTLYECKTEEDIQKFKKYYAKGEELCTFRGNRLNRCYVFFAVKKDVDNIKREDYKEPFREDEYGTSVISIQFTRGSNSYLSIKNRYNHTVPNPDATFNNNLDNIIPGLSYAFQKQYGLSYRNIDDNFYIPFYVKAKDGKYYKYNYEINNIYYCPNNIIIDNFEVKRYSDEYQRYLVVDYFVIDRQNKKIYLYDEEVGTSTSSKVMDDDELYAYDEVFGDSFIEYFENNEIENIKISTNEDGSRSIIVSIKDKEDAIITIDKFNRIIGYKNNNITSIHNNFLLYNEIISRVEMKNVRDIGDNFLKNGHALKNLITPNLISVGDDFLLDNYHLEELLLPRLERVGDDFLSSNILVKEVILPNLKKVGNSFLLYNEMARVIELPLLEVVGNRFMSCAFRIDNIDMSSLREHGTNFLNSYKGDINGRKIR